MVSTRKWDPARSTSWQHSAMRSCWGFLSYAPTLRQHLWCPTEPPKPAKAGETIHAVILTGGDCFPRKMNQGLGIAPNQKKKPYPPTPPHPPTRAHTIS